MASAPPTTTAIQSTGSSTVSTSQTSGHQQPSGSQTALTPQALSTTTTIDLGYFTIVPPTSLTQPEYMYRAEVDFSFTVKKSAQLLKCICLLLTALLNAVGGILILAKRPGTPCTSQVLDQWQRDLGQKLAFIPDREILITIGADANHIFLYARKSQGITLYDSHFFTKDGPSKTKSFNPACLARFMQQDSRSSSVNIPDILHYKQVLQLPESPDVEYKLWNIARKRSHNIQTNTEPFTVIGVYQKCIGDVAGAIFALPNNRRGGKMLIGIHDDGNVIIGQKLSESEEIQLIAFLVDFLTVDPETHIPRIWGEEGVSPRRGTHWDVTFVPVRNTPDTDRRVVIVINFNHCPGGVFMRCPEVYTINHDATLRQLSFCEVRENILAGNYIPQELQTSQELHLPSVEARARIQGEPSGSSSILSNISSTQELVPNRREEVARNIQKQSTFSWTDHHENWSDHIDVRPRDLDKTVLQQASTCTALQSKQPLHFTPEESVITNAHPGIGPALAAMKTYGQEGFAVVTTTILNCFLNKTQLPMLAEHVTDALVVTDNNMHYWVVVKKQGDHANREKLREYLYISGRTMKEYLVQALFKWTNTATVVPLHCHVFSLDDAEIVEENDIPEALTEAPAPLGDLKLGLSCMFLSKETQIKSIFGDDLVIHLTDKQHEIVYEADLPGVTFIIGPPGTGKSVIGFTMCKKNKAIYIVTNAELKAYVAYLNVAHTALVKNGNDLLKLIDDGNLHDKKYIILDDVQTMIFPPEVWQSVLNYIKNHRQAHLILLGDPDVQNYMDHNHINGLRAHVESFCREEQIPIRIQDLTVIHRNSQKVVAYLHECTHKPEPLPCTSPVQGDDIEMLVMSNIREDSTNNQLVEYLKSIVSPEAQLDLGSVTRGYRCRDVLLMVAGSDTSQVVEHFRQLLDKHLAVGSVQQPETYPVKGIRVGGVGDFHGLDSPVCICITDDVAISTPAVATESVYHTTDSLSATPQPRSQYKNILKAIRKPFRKLLRKHRDQRSATDDSKQQDSDETVVSTQTSLMHPRYRAFVCSRAIHKVVYITELVTMDMALELGYDNLTRFHAEDSELPTQTSPPVPSDVATVHARAVIYDNKPRLVFGHKAGVYLIEYGVSVNHVTGHILVPDDNSICLYSLSGQYDTSYGSKTRDYPGLVSPRGVTVDKQGQTIVTSNHCVSIFSVNGTLVKSFGKKGVARGEFYDPHDVACDDEGLLYIVDTYNKRVQVCRQSGECVRVVGDGDPGKLKHPIGIALDSDGDIYLADYGARQVLIYTQSGRYKSSITVRDTPHRLWWPRYVAVDGHRQVYVTDGINDCVHVFKDGRHIQQIGREGGSEGCFRRPSGITLSHKGDLVVHDGGNYRIQVFGIKQVQ